ncbi:MAG: tyrosine-protein kinase family protein [Lachnospiraceae bacterium]|nr:tyrosine-protein kinase family protein [Lachnospiraceae bacterium]
MTEQILNSLKNFILVTGHYGCGKTNFTMNLALDYAKAGRKVTVVDMDLINPYFRTSDFKGVLEEKGIEVITPVFGGTNLDIPSLPASMYGIFEKKDVVIIDVGGDDAGSMVLGRFKPQFDTVDYDMLYVINRFRSLSTDLDEAIEVLGEIEAVSGLKPHYLINNSHMMAETGQAIYDEGKQFAEMISEKTGLKVLCHTLDKELYDKGIVIPDVDDSIYPIDIHVKTIWQKQKMVQI